VSEPFEGYGPLEFTVRRAVLSELAGQAAVAVPTRDTLEVLGCFRVTVEPGRLQLGATDMMLTVLAETPSVRAGRCGVLYLPARKLRAILSEAPDGDVTVSVAGQTAGISAARGHWDVHLPRPKGAAELLDPARFSFSGTGREALLKGLKTVRHAVCRDSARPAYTQVRIEAGEAGTWAWATDGSQFSRAPVPGFPFGATVPGAMLDDLIRLLGADRGEQVQVAQDDRTFVVRAGPVTLAGQRSAKAFPGMDDLLLKPTAANDAKLEADKAELLAAVRRVAVNASDKTSAMALVADDSHLAIQASDDRGNKSEEVIAASWGGPRRLIVVNWRYLTEMVSAHPEASCTFLLGPDKGRSPSMVRLDDPASGVIGAIVQQSSSGIRL
jgi:DNA polymerase III sliding clamp (beta) subunit (PCNA family)